MWILVLIVISSYKTTIDHIEFYSEKDCISAGMKLSDSQKDNRYGNLYVECVYKGEIDKD